MGATYDLFGTGRTALKVTLNKYLEGMGTTGAGGVPNVSRPAESDQPVEHADDAARGPTTAPTAESPNDFIPQCNLQDYSANGECGALLNAAIFGTIVPGTSYDPDLMQGWGKRFNNWEFTTSVQHELMPRVSLNVQYARRWYGNFRVIDDRVGHGSGLRPVHDDGPDRCSPAEQRRHADGIRSEADGAARRRTCSSRSPTTTASRPSTSTP